MPLIIKLENGLDKPVVVCDQCGHEIKTAEVGNYGWRTDEKGRPVDGRIFFTHKSCTHPFETRNGGSARWNVMELECLPVYLARTLGVTSEEVEWKADYASGLVEFTD
jgi:hypothetical protein